MTAASWPHDLSRRNSVPAWREPHADLQMSSSGPFGLAAQDLILGRKAGAPSLASCLDSESATARTRPRVAGTCCLLRPCATIWAGALWAFYHSRMLGLAAADSPFSRPLAGSASTTKHEAWMPAKTKTLGEVQLPSGVRHPVNTKCGERSHAAWYSPSKRRPTACPLWIRQMSCCCSFKIQHISQVPALRA